MSTIPNNTSMRASNCRTSVFANVAVMTDAFAINLIESNILSNMTAKAQQSNRAFVRNKMKQHSSLNKLKSRLYKKLEEKQKQSESS
jgi:hypothetical protein